jgi:ankyrin repeat protein
MSKKKYSYPKKEHLSNVDYKHKTFTEICTFEEFMANSSAQINKIFE